MPFSNFKPFSLLLTGAPGWLCNALLSRLGSTFPSLTRVRCLIESGSTDEQIAAFRFAHPSVTETLFGNLLDAESLRAACHDMRNGVVLHAAAIFQPKKISDYYAVNRDGTLKLAQFARESGARRFVFISTTAAQGASRSAAQPLTEELPCRPYSHYGKSKRDAEAGLMALHGPSFEVVILRPGPFYGTPVPPHQSELFKRIKSGRASLIGRGKYTRSWSHIDDLVTGVLTTLVHPAAAGETFNLCDTELYTQRDIYEAIARALDIRPKFRRVPAIAASFAHLTGNLKAKFDRYDKALHLMADQNRHTAASSEKAQRLLGLEPQHTLRENLRAAVAWCQDQGLLDH